MTRVLVVTGLALWVGAALLLSELRWFRRLPLTERLRPYVVGGVAGRSGPGLLSVESFREAIGPIARGLGERVSRLFGVSEDLSVRLRRVHAELDVTGFRTRQLGAALGGMAAGGLLAAALRPPGPIVLLLLLGAPVLGFLVLEQRLSKECSEWQRRVFLELPVVAEQVAMLLSSGYSLNAALDRVARRGKGASARDLSRVVGRIQQGLDEQTALLEWTEVVQVDAVDRFVQVLALNRQATDLGRLLSEEARAIRREVHRELLELVERRDQQVWIPVTVATLLPGVIFLSVPLLQALRLYTG